MAKWLNEHFLSVLFRYLLRFGVSLHNPPVAPYSRAFRYSPILHHSTHTRTLCVSTFLSLLLLYSETEIISIQILINFERQSIFYKFTCHDIFFYMFLRHNRKYSYFPKILCDTHYPHHSANLREALEDRRYLLQKQGNQELFPTEKSLS